MCVTHMHVTDGGKNACHLRLVVVVMGGIRFQLHTCNFPFTHRHAESELVVTSQKKKKKEDKRVSGI